MDAVTGPKEDSPKCSVFPDCSESDKKLSNNINKALLIDYFESRLISCGSLFQGICTVRSLRNISNVEERVTESVVANNATASTVAFIAPGPPNPPITQVCLGFIFSPFLAMKKKCRTRFHLLRDLKCHRQAFFFTLRTAW